MEYILLAVVVLFVLYIAWMQREARLEREALNKAYRNQVSELLTRISHPELVVVPETPQVVDQAIDDEEDRQFQEQIGLVGTVDLGVNNE